MWPESKSFKDEGIGPVPSKWKGICQNDKDKRFICNRGLNHVQKLHITEAHSLSRISELPALTELNVTDCPMLDCVEEVESLQNLKIRDEKDDSLPKWLISFLQQRKQHHGNQFNLHLECSTQALKGCLKGRPYWDFLQQVPRLEAYAENKSLYLKYTKEPFSYQTNLVEDIN